MKILILGNKGYIGSALSNYLTQAEFVVDGVDIGWFEKRSSPLNYDYKNLSKEYITNYDAIILLAGHSSVPMCKNNMVSAFKNNVSNFIDLLSKIKAGQKFIYASSSSVYGDTASSLATENWDRFRPKSYYDLTKQEIDFYAELSNVEYYGLRFGTVNGCGLTSNFRTDIMINKMYHTYYLNRKIEVFNTHVSRPILGINDLCEAVEFILNGKDHRGIYNLASFNSTVKDITTEFAKYLPDVNIVNLGNTPTYNFSIDTSKFSNTYNFKFTDTVENIINDIKEKYTTVHSSIREWSVEYV